MKKIKYSKLLEFSFNILKKSGVKTEIARIVSEGLCETSIRGTDSHGIRLLEHYSQSALLGRKNPRPKIKIYHPFPSICKIDGDNTYGHYLGIKAVNEGIKMAKKNGIAFVNVYNSTHCGALAYSAIHASKKGYICMSFTHADSLMLTHNSIDTFFGTNPICFSAPRKNEEPFCLDMATTNISWNKMLANKKQNINFKDKILADKNGNLTGNTKLAKSLIAIGGYKGFGLGMMVEIMCGVYSGMNIGKKIPAMFTSPLNIRRKLSQSYIILRTDAVINQKDFIKSLSKMSKEIRNQIPKKGKNIMVANDPEIKSKKLRLKHGIPITDEIEQQFKRLSKKFKVFLKV